MSQMQTMKAEVFGIDKPLEADELLMHAVKMARQSMQEQGGWPPLLFAAGNHEGRPVIMQADMFEAGVGSTDGRQRDAAWQLAKEAVESIDAHAACATMEAWMSIFPKGEDALMRSLGACQDTWPEWAIKKYRKEALVFTLETPTRIEVYHCAIDRDSEDKPVVRDIERQQVDADVAGRGVGLLWTPPASQASPMN